MIWQRPISAAEVELTFILRAIILPAPVGVAGEFNDWRWRATLSTTTAAVSSLASLPPHVTATADRGDTPVSEDDTFRGMKYTLGSHPAPMQAEAGPTPLSHLLVDLAHADLLEQHPAPDPDQRPS